MAIVLEDGSGVKSANSYIDSAYGLAYLTARNRETENLWSTVGATSTDAACVGATDHVEYRFSQLFSGCKRWDDLNRARASFTLTAIPGDSETVILGATTYTFNTVLGGANSVLIGASIDASLENLLTAITGDDTQEGLTIGVGTDANATASADANFGNSIYAEALNAGTAGNIIASTTTVTGGSWNFATLTSGADDGAPQRLSFPRLYVYDRDGILVQGVPVDLKNACVEYAVRILSAPLIAEFETNGVGDIVTFSTEKVGPLEDTKKYTAGGASTLIQPIPAADRMIRQYLRSGGTGGAIR